MPFKNSVWEFLAKSKNSPGVALNKLLTWLDRLVLISAGLNVLLLASSLLCRDRQLYVSLNMHNFVILIFQLQNIVIKMFQLF